MADIPVRIEEFVPENVVYLLPPVAATVYLSSEQTKPTFQQEMDALVEAYTQAARRGEVGVIKLGNHVRG